MTTKNKTMIAALQLGVLAMAIIALVVMAITHAISDRSLDALFGVILGHTGIVAYNGATHTSQNPTVTTDPTAHVVGQRKADAVVPIVNVAQPQAPTETPAGPPPAGPQATS